MFRFIAALLSSVLPSVEGDVLTSMGTMVGILGDDAEWVAKDAGLVFTTSQASLPAVGLGHAIVKSLVEGDPKFGQELLIMEDEEYMLYWTGCATSGACLAFWGGMAGIEIYVSLMSTWSIVHDAESVLSTDLLQLKNDLVDEVSTVRDTRERLVTAFAAKTPLLGDLESNVEQLLNTLHTFTDDANDAIHQAETANDNPSDVIANLRDMKSKMRTIRGHLLAMKTCGSFQCSASTWSKHLGACSTCLNGVCWDLHTAMVSWSDAGGNLNRTDAVQCSGSNAALVPDMLTAQPMMTASETEVAQLDQVLQDLRAFEGRTAKMQTLLYYWAAAVLGAVMVVSMYRGYTKAATQRCRHRFNPRHPMAGRPFLEQESGGDDGFYEPCPRLAALLAAPRRWKRLYWTQPGAQTGDGSSSSVNSLIRPLIPRFL